MLTHSKIDKRLEHNADMPDAIANQNNSSVQRLELRTSTEKVVDGHSLWKLNAIRLASIGGNELRPTTGAIGRAVVQPSATVGWSFSRIRPKEGRRTLA